MKEIVKNSADLVVLVDDEPRVSSYVLAEGCDITHDAALRLINKYMEKLKKRGRVRFEIEPFKTEGGIQRRRIAWLNEPQATFLITLMRNTEPVVEFKDRLTEAFFRMREALAQPPQLDDPAALRGLLLNYTERVLKLEAKIEEDAPKVDFYERFMNADGLYGLQNAARAIGAKPNKFIQWLKSKYLFYQGGHLVARVRYIQMGIFEVKSTIVDDKARPRTYITPKGLKYLAERVPPDIMVENAQRSLAV